MTSEQFDVLVKLMRGDPDSAANKAARAVLVHGISPREARETFALAKTTVSQAVTRYAKAYDSVIAAFSSPK